MKIAFDLGHGMMSGRDRGADGFILEETIINDVGSFVVAKLRALGHEVIETRPTQADTIMDSLSQRVNKANDNNVDLFVCLHANAGGGQGTEVFTYEGKELEQARNVLNNIVALGFRNRGIKGESLYVTNHTNADSFLIEVCFVDTQSDVDLYNSLGAEVIADAIVKGIVGETIEVIPSISNTQSISTEQSPIEKARQFVGNRCLELQQKLNQAFGYDIAEDNDFGNQTYTALGETQLKLGIACDYMAGNQTFNALDNYIANKNKSQSVLQSNNILLIQQLCNSLGANISEDGIYGNQTESAIKNLPLCGIPYTQRECTRFVQIVLGIDIDGIFLYGTESSVKEFQSNHNLENDGKVGFNTYRALCLS